MQITIKQKEVKIKIVDLIKSKIIFIPSDKSFQEIEQIYDYFKNQNNCIFTFSGFDEPHQIELIDKELKECIKDFNYNSRNYTVLNPSYFGEYEFYSKDENALSEAINYFYQNINIDGLEYSYLSQKELIRFENNFILKENRENQRSFGMTYYSYFEEMSTTFRNEDAKFLVAHYNNIVVGIIKIGIYGYNDQRHLAMTYIDVSRFFRNKGLATMLIKKLDEYLNEFEYDNLILTHESGDGRTYHISDMFSKYIKSKNVVHYKSLLE